MLEKTVVVVGLVVALLGCKAGPAEPSAFIGEKGDMVDEPAVKTFHKAWIKPGVDWDKYKKLYAAPVDTRYLREMKWWQDTSLAGREDERIADLAKFTRETFIKAHKENKGKYPLKVVDSPSKDPGLVIMELALIEVVPTTAWLNTVSYAGVMMTIDKGTVAMEGRLKDGQTGDIICKFADREEGKQNLIGNVKDFQWYGHAEAIIEEWAEQTVEITNAEEGDEVGDSIPFELKVW